MITRGSNGEVNYKNFVKEVTDFAIENIPVDGDIIGILFCEGAENSIDNAIYSNIFPNLYVIPVGGCSTVVRFTPRVRQALNKYGIYTYGIIDRDALSKKEMKALYRKTGVYTTKLPFAENIICCPQVLEIVCQERGLDFELILKKVESELLKILWQKLKEALPINLGIESRERILYLSIGAGTRKKKIDKFVNAESILYSYRDKILVAIVGNAIGLNGRKEYYKYIIDLIDNPKYTAKLANIFANFVPKFELYPLE